jgi:AcrR family transcriptional regulator
VGNATLYRHFPTRSDLLVAVYGDQVAELCRRADRPLGDRPPEVALFEWLDEFVVHVANKRDLALAITETADGRRTALFNQWHATITDTAARRRSGQRCDPGADHRLRSARAAQRGRRGRCGHRRRAPTPGDPPIRRAKPRSDGSKSEVVCTADQGCSALQWRVDDGTDLALKSAGPAG